MFVQRKRGEMMMISSRVNNTGNTVPSFQVDECFAEEVKRWTWYEDANGYLRRNIHAGPRYIHGLVWELSGREDTPRIDHINRDKSDNRLNNLRDATSLLNAKNTRHPSAPSGLPCGVRKQGSRFWSQISHRSHQKRLGTFDTIEEASEVYENAREILIEFAALPGYEEVIRWLEI